MRLPRSHKTPHPPTPSFITLPPSNPKPPKPRSDDLPTHPTLTTAETRALTHLLSLPPSTPLLSTKIAWLGTPLSRPTASPWPSELCEVHNWFNPVFVAEISQLLKRELGGCDDVQGLAGPERDPEGLGRLWDFPRETLGWEVRPLLQLLRPCLDLFDVDPGSWTTVSTPLSPLSPARSLDGEGRGDAVDPGCEACTLHCFFRDADAVQALAKCAKGRKHHKRPWPEVLVWLEGDDGVGWRGRWLKEGRAVRRERRRARVWRECGGLEAGRGEWRGCVVEEEGEKGEGELGGLGKGECADGGREVRNLHRTWFEKCAMQDGETVGVEEVGPPSEEIARARQSAFERLVGLRGPGLGKR